jgi:lipopolysaccharide/colanic/teichoic acid biosynthesis glycosyltransferase
MSSTTNRNLTVPYDRPSAISAADGWPEGHESREPRSLGAEIRERVYESTTRILGAFVSAIALIVLSPLLLVIAVLIRLDSPGPILFRHRRIGINRRKNRRKPPAAIERRKEDQFGRPFTLYKFRSMYHDARERFPHLYSYSYSDEEMRTLPIKILVSTKADPRDFNDRRKIDEMQTPDPRVTALGRWLRSTSLDELPNFINVLFGDMNLVGPRPDIAENIRFYPAEHMRKLNVKPGITGLAQVNGRGKLSFQETNEYDVLYVDNRSLWLDLKILAKTVVVSLKRDGAF